MSLRNPLTQEPVDDKENQDVSNHPAFLSDWCSKIKKQMMQAPNGCYAIIYAGECVDDLAAAKKLGIKPTRHPAYTVINTNNHQLYGVTLAEIPGWGVVKPGKSTGEFSTFNLPNICTFVKTDLVNYQFTFDEFQRNPGKFKHFVPVQLKVSAEHANENEIWVNFLNNLIIALSSQKEFQWPLRVDSSLRLKEYTATRKELDVKDEYPFPKGVKEQLINAQTNDQQRKYRMESSLTRRLEALFPQIDVDGRVETLVFSEESANILKKNIHVLKQALKHDTNKATAVGIYNFVAGHISSNAATLFKSKIRSLEDGLFQALESANKRLGIN